MVRLGGIVFAIAALLVLAVVLVRSETSSVSVANVPPAAELDPPAPVVVAEDVVGDVVEETTFGWEGYPHLPYRPVMTEVEGLPIPRSEPTASDYVVGGSIPVDKDNPAARPTDRPVTGGSLSIRFNSEPKVLNPITESSAVQTYIYSYVSDPLVNRNPETFEWEPAIAARWVAEDSVKLRPDFPGRERRVALEGGAPAESVEVSFPEPPAPGSEAPPPSPLVFRVSDADGIPVPRAWIGIFPKDGPSDAEHFWTDDTGRAEVAGLPGGDYVVRTGFEVYGTLADEGEGFRLASETTPDAEPLTLSRDDVIDVQRGTVFTYYLRDDVTWSDGQPFTSADLEFGYRVINNRFVDGDPIRVYYADIVECEPLEPYVVRMKYRKQYFQAFEFTTALSAYCPPRHLFERKFREQGRTLVMDDLTPEQEQANRQVSVRGQTFGRFFNRDERYNVQPLGMGPYVVESWSKRDKRLVLRRRPDYWDPDRAGYLDRIVVRFIEDPTTGMQALRAGEIDFFWGPTPEQFFEELAGPPAWIERDYVKAAWFYPMFSYVGLNLRREPFNDRRVRIALAMLFDRKTFLERKQHGAGVLVSGSQYYFGPAYDHSVLPIAYDPDAALDLLAAAGWIDTDGDGILDKDGQRFSFEFLLPSGNPTARAMGEMLQYSYKRAGIEVRVLELEWASFLERIQSRQFDVTSLAWASSLESDPYQIWHSSQADPSLRSSNHVGFANSDADQLIERIRITLDEEERKRLFYTFHRIIDAEQPYNFLWARQELGIYPQKFRGVKFYAVRPGFDLREWYIPEELQ